MDTKKIAGGWAVGVLGLGAALMAILLPFNCSPIPVPSPHRLETLISKKTGPACGFSDTTLYPKSMPVSLASNLLDTDSSFIVELDGQSDTLLLAQRRQEMLYRTWVGKIQGHPDGSFMFVKRGEQFSGSIFTEDGEYVLRRCADGKYSLAMIDQLSLPLDEDSLLATPAQYETIENCMALNPNDAYTIDVLVLYTAKARQHIGSGDLSRSTEQQQLDMETEIAKAVEVTNAAFLDGKLPFRLQIVGVLDIGDGDATVQWEGSGSVANLLGQLGAAPSVRALRNRYSADLVSLIVEGNDADLCGKANFYESAPESAGNAFSVVRRKCLEGKYSFSHEIGHNLGLDHQCSISSRAGDGHGYIFVNAIGKHMGTLMASDPDITRIPYFSDQLNLRGVIRSERNVPNCTANDVKSLREVAIRVANYRCSGVVNDVWLNDNYEDKGDEPNASLMTNRVLISPFMWVRQEQDKNLIHLYQHENPSTNGKQNYLYVKVRNGSCSPQSGKLKVYGGPATLNWHPLPGNLLNPNAETTILPPMTTIILEVPFTNSSLAPSWNYLAEWHSGTVQPLANFSTLLECVTDHNDVAAKCLAKLYVGTGGAQRRQANANATASTVTTTDLYFTPQKSVNFALKMESGPGGLNFDAAGGDVRISFEANRIALDSMGVPVDTTRQPAEVWKPSYVRELRPDREGLAAIKLPKWIAISEEGKKGTMHISFDASRIMQPGTYIVHVWEMKGPEPSGSYSYEISVGDVNHP